MNPSIMQERSGAWLHDPQRKRKDAKSRAPLGRDDYPEGFTQNEIKMWYEIFDNAPLYVLKNSDKILVATAAKLSARIFFTPELSHTLLIQLSSSLRQLLSLMGMTPADRQRVSGTSNDEFEEDALDEFRIY